MATAADAPRRPLVPLARLRLVWGVSAGLTGLAVGALIRPRLPMGLVGAAAGATLGASLAEPLTRMLPILGFAIGPFLAFLAMNVERFIVLKPAADPLSESGSSSAMTEIPPASFLSTSAALLAAAVATSIAGWALSNRALGGPPVGPGAVSLAWLCLFVAIVMVLISHFSAA